VPKSVAAWLLAGAALALGLVLWRGDSAKDGLAGDAGIAPFPLLNAASEEAFARVASPWSFRFPADHGSHDDYRSEWWHLAGTLAARNGRRLGMQLIMVRLGLKAQPPAHRSRWAASQIYAAMFSVSDPAGEGLRTDQRMARAALALAGTGVEPIRIWVEDWRLEGRGSQRKKALDLEVHIAGDDLEANLELRNSQPLVDTNEIPEPASGGAAPFQFYLQPRLSAEGTLRLGKRITRVSGTLALEHAWGELPLPGSPVARDRFTLHLHDGGELFCVRSHRVDGSGSPTTTGLLIDHQNRPVVLSAGEIELDPTGYWTSPRTGVTYPIHWALRIPAQGIELALIPEWEDQEDSVWEPFWAGPVRLQATSTTTGYGFVQLHGYERS
jgi:predicted secreted hydrolase